MLWGAFVVVGVQLRHLFCFTRYRCLKVTRSGTN